MADAEKLEKTMFMLIDYILKQETTILELSMEIADDECELANKELEMKDIIANEVDEKGKPVYSNEMKRQAALLEMKAEDSTIADLELKIKENKYAVATAQINLRHKKNMLDINKLVYQGLISK